MRIFHLSDTHGKHKLIKGLPSADVIVHSGDFTFAGSEDEAFDFINWFCDLPYKHKIFIAGNHDFCMHGADGIEGLPDDVHYLCNSGVEIEGLHFYGVPLFMEDVMDLSLNKYYASVPSSTNVLVTHQPPYGFGDCADYGSGKKHMGSMQLRESITHLPFLKCHLFGHEHDAVDITDHEGIIFSNASVMDDKYNLYGKVGAVIEI